MPIEDQGNHLNQHVDLCAKSFFGNQVVSAITVNF